MCPETLILPFVEAKFLHKNLLAWRSEKKMPLRLSVRQPIAFFSARSTSTATAPDVFNSMNLLYESIGDSNPGPWRLPLRIRLSHLTQDLAAQVQPKQRATEKEKGL